VSLYNKVADYKHQLSGWFIDREFFMRADGQVRFLRISAQLQRRVAAVIAGVIGLWLLITLGMAINQVSISFERMALVSKEAKVQSAEERVANYRDSIDSVAKDISKRQDALDSMAEQLQSQLPAGTKVPESSSISNDETVKKVSAAVPEAAGLAQLEARQIRFAEKLTFIANLRAKRAADVLRQYGLNPDSITETAQGGPYIPFFGGSNEAIKDPRFDRLAIALQHMNSMEQALANMPTSMPASVMTMSSNYGYRHDPFTGRGAMHSGLDFKGPIGTPILAAASGQISFAGVKSGYGNCLEITHANGLVTRYAHLSSFTVALGQRVNRGVQIARMGNTGRSTGSHLHFEVRLNDQAVNPLKFLEANPNVLEVQTSSGTTHSASTTQP
jgi:murein DD-endopeptidase MepM/ murein hydrolase activator NlpD